MTKLWCICLICLLQLGSSTFTTSLRGQKLAIASHRQEISTVLVSRREEEYVDPYGDVLGDGDDGTDDGKDDGTDDGTGDGTDDGADDFTGGANPNEDSTQDAGDNFSGADEATRVPEDFSFGDEKETDAPSIEASGGVGDDGNAATDDYEDGGNDGATTDDAGTGADNSGYVPPIDDVLANEGNGQSIIDKWKTGQGSMTDLENEGQAIANDPNVWIAAVVLSVVGFFFLLFVVHQVVENPQGCTAKLFRCLVALFRIVCWPCRKVCCCCCPGGQARPRGRSGRSNIPTDDDDDDNYSRDLELT